MATKPDSTLGEKLRDGSLYERAPLHLRAAVLEHIGGLAEERKPRRLANLFERLNWLTGLSFVGGGAAGAALCALIMTSMFSPHSNAIQQEIVASHVRALISSRDIDVVSTDQHTVKPWFNGRINYAPPVFDTDSQGFPLVGGRLDYVGHRPVAVLIYRYLKHPLDLYVFPDASSGQSPNPSTLKVESSDGYSVVRWSENGMAFWAISDASTSHVKQFAEAIQGAEGR